MSGNIEMSQGIIALMTEHFPLAIKGDTEQSAQCANVLCAALGGLLASVARDKDEDFILALARSMTGRILTHAVGICSKAAAIEEKQNAGQAVPRIGKH